MSNGENKKKQKELEDREGKGTVEQPKALSDGRKINCGRPGATA